MQQLKQGTLLQGGKYRIEKVLGQGGFGITYLAVQEMLDRKVCLKEFFYKEYCERNEETSHVTLGTQSNHELVERFLNKFLKEARTISQLDHPNIIHIHDIFRENNTAYYVMDYIEGESLAEKVKNEGALHETIATDYIKQVASALDFIHKQSINHLDVKPANIMVRKADNRAILIDFGLSKQYDAQGGQTSTTPVGISHGYAPMEQYNAGGVSTFSPQTDIYSLGATLYKLVTGITPPQASDVLNDGLPELPAHISTAVKDTITATMQVRKKDRPADINSALSLLKEGVSGNLDNRAKETENKTTTKNEPIDEETKVISSIPTNDVKNIEYQKISENYNKENHNNHRKKYLWIIGITIALSFIVYECTINNSPSIITNNTNTLTEQISKSTPIIVAPPLHNNTSKSILPQLKIKKLKEKYVDVELFDDYINEWAEGNSLKLDLPIFDSAPTFYNYNAELIKITESSIPLKLNDRYLYYWRKDENYNYLAYGAYEYGDGTPIRLLITNHDNTILLGDFIFNNYVYPSQYILSEKQFVDQKVCNFTIEGNILYFAHYHSTYASSSYGENGRISAIDINTGKVLWTSDNLVCNSNFVIYDNYIVTGYGFTDEPDNINILDKLNGAFMKKVPIANAPEIIAVKENKIFARTYSYDYEFIITN